MKHFFFTLVFSLICALSIAQTSFSNNILNGDIKMKEGFYEMALTYYRNARSSASNGEEVATAERKISDCERIIKDIEKQKEIALTKSKILFSEQYLEQGDVYVGSIDSYDDSFLSAGDEGESFSLFAMDVYDDHVRILSHEDGNTSTELDIIPAGAIIPLVKETSKYRRYASNESGEDFIIFKKNLRNEFGRYHVALRKEGNKYLRLYSWAEVRHLMQDSGKEGGMDDSYDEKNHHATEQTRNASESTSSTRMTSREILPISFIENWALNLDSNGYRLGDTRSEPLRASEVRWLTLRLRYTCPDNYENPVRFDIRIETPSGKVMKINGKGVSKGFSTYEVLETIPGGGIFNIAFGADEPGSFERGKYIVGIWHDDVQYYSVIVNLL